MQYFRNLLLITLTCAACAPQTNTLHITYYGEDALDDARITPMQQQIDAAAVTASMLAGLDPDKVFDGSRFFAVGFHSGPMSWNGKLYAGLTTSDSMRVMFVEGCLFDHTSALLHEFFHRMLGIAHNGDMDEFHTDPRWQAMGQLNAALAEHYCPTERPAVPEFQGSIR